ncbi:branched-chain amino acid ABC transporter permease [Candidatus Gracilibacteria bacterium]|nr:branched-chain amino acid ABC transporter permease [Candidatus Gracilibacteria bacterium]
MIFGLEIFSFLETKATIIPQLLWNGLVSGALIALVSLGLTLIYSIAGFIQFAHGELVALGAYSFMVFHKWLNWEILPASGGALFFVILVGLLLEKFFFRPVSQKDSMIPLVISIGLSMGIQSIILIIFGANILTMSNNFSKSHSFFNNTILATYPQILTVALSIFLMISLILFLKHSKIGKSIRAVSSNRAVAETFGINVNKSLQWIFGIGALMAGIAGICLGFEQNLEPLMGVHILIKAFAAIILGSIGSIRGAIFGAFLIGVSENLLVGLGIIPSGFSVAIPFIILILMLLIKPEGLLGKRFESLRQ